MLRKKKETTIVWEYGVDNNANIANFVCCEKRDSETCDADQNPGTA